MITSEQYSSKRLGFFCLFIMLVLSVFWQANELTTDFISAFYPAVFLVAGLFFLSTRISSEIKLYHYKVMIVLLVFIIINFVSVTWSVYPAQSLWEAGKLLLYFFIFIVSSQILSENDAQKLMKIMLFVGIFEALLPIYDFLVVKKAAFTLATYSGRAMGTFPGPNGYGIFLLMIFLLACGLFSRMMSTKKRILCFLMMAVLVCGIVLSGSRGVWICSFISLTYFFAAEKPIRRKHIFILTAVVTGVILALTVIKLSASNNTVSALVITDAASNASIANDKGEAPALISRIQIPADKVLSLNSRTPIWKAAVEMCLSRPLTGYGLGTFRRMYGSFQVELKEYPHYVHNHYLQTFAETGVLSFLLFILFTFLNVKTLLRAYQLGDGMASAMAASVLAFSLHILIDFDWNFFAITSIYFFVLGSLYRRLISDNPSDYYKINYSRPVKYTALFLVLLTGSIAGIQLANRYVLDQGNLFFQQGQFKQAEEKAKIAAGLFPIDPLANILLSQLSLKKAPPDIEESILYTRKGIELDPYNSWNYNQLGHLLGIRGDKAGAIEHYKKALSLNRSELSFYLNLGRALIKNNQLNEGEEVLNRGYALRNGVPKYFFKQTENEVRKQSVEISIELIKIYLKKDPSKAKAVSDTLIQENPDAAIQVNKWLETEAINS